MPAGMRLISGLSAASIVSTEYLQWAQPQSFLALFFAMVLYGLAAVLFAWTIAVTRSVGLKLAFDPNLPSTFTRLGPYRYIRHPFYAAYILFWLGCAISTQHAISFAFLALLSILYTAAALREERSFAGTPYAADYTAYRRSAGMFWPMWGG